MAEEEYFNIEPGNISRQYFLRFFGVSYYLGKVNGESWSRAIVNSSNRNLIQKAHQLTLIEYSGQKWNHTDRQHCFFSVFGRSWNQTFDITVLSFV